MIEVYDAHLLGLVGKYHGMEYVCRCPFHEDRNPSASFNIKRGVLYCFGCGACAGVKEIARKTRGLIQKNKVNGKFLSKFSTHDEWRRLLEYPIAKRNDYLRSRGVSNFYARLFNIRQLPNGVGIPIKNENEKEVGIVIRQYENLPKYLVFGEKFPIWPDPQFVKEQYSYDDRLFVVEGIFGAMRAISCGVSAVASLGAMIKPEISTWISSRTVYGLFDNDHAGYVAGGRLLTFNPLSRIIIPGQEADELEKSEWRFLNYEDPLTTNRMSKLAMMSKNPKLFYKYMPKER